MRCLFVLLIISPATLACVSHTECSDTQFCHKNETCQSLESCTNSNSIDASCPSSDTACTSHTECNVNTQYCDINNECFACSACILAEDSIDGKCPPWCTIGLDDDDVTPAPKSSSSSGSSDDGAIVAVVVVLALLIIGGIGYWFYTSRNDAMPNEKEGVALRQVLALQNKADTAVRRMSVRNSMVDRPPPIPESAAAAEDNNQQDLGQKKTSLYNIQLPENPDDAIQLALREHKRAYYGGTGSESTVSEQPSIQAPEPPRGPQQDVMMFENSEIDEEV